MLILLPDGFWVVSGGKNVVGGGFVAFPVG